MRTAIRWSKGILAKLAMGRAMRTMAIKRAAPIAISFSISCSFLVGPLNVGVIINIIPYFPAFVND